MMKTSINPLQIMKKRLNIFFCWHSLCVQYSRFKLKENLTGLHRGRPMERKCWVVSEKEPVKNLAWTNWPRWCEFHQCCRWLPCIFTGKRHVDDRHVSAWNSNEDYNSANAPTE